MPRTASDAQFLEQLKGFSLTTAEILYKLPDHRSILQSYVWQDYDMYPTFPRLTGFLEFWHTKLDGPIHKVLVAHSKLIGARELRLVKGGFHLN